MSGRRIAGIDVAFGDVELRLVGDIANDARFRAGAEQRPLRAAQYFDAVEIEDCWEGVDGTEADVARLDRRVVDVDAGGRGAGRRIDAADVDVGTFVVVVARRTHAIALEIQTGREPGQIVDILEALRIHLLLTEGEDTHGDILQSLDAAGCGDDDLFKAAARCRLRIPGRQGDGRPRQLASQGNGP